MNPPSTSSSSPTPSAGPTLQPTPTSPDIKTPRRTPRGPYKYLSLAKKVSIIARVDAGESKRSVAKSLGLNESTVRSIYSQREKIKNAVKASRPVWYWKSTDNDQQLELTSRANSKVKDSPSDQEDQSNSTSKEEEVKKTVAPEQVQLPVPLVQLPVPLVQLPVPLVQLPVPLVQLPVPLVVQRRYSREPSPEL